MQSATALAHAPPALPGAAALGAMPEATTLAATAATAATATAATAATAPRRYTKEFFVRSEPRRLYAEHVRYIVQRTNSLTGVTYRDDPTIMAWELANEPRPMKAVAAFRDWIGETVAMVRPASGGIRSRWAGQMVVEVWIRAMRVNQCWQRVVVNWATLR